MSAGAVFKLIANDGKADRMIMATKLLNQRIKDVMCARTQDGKADNMPTLIDLERTHILYVNAHFKPFAAIGYEYNKVRPQSGNPTLGGGVTFSIPQFGDFFYDMVCRTRLSAVAGNPGQTPTVGTAAFPVNEAGVQYNIVDASGNVLVVGNSAPTSTGQLNYSNYVRYCEFPGNRLFHTVKFDVNGNPLDSYDEFIPTMLEKFCTPPNKRVGHDRLVGQEVPLIGYSGLKNASVLDFDWKNTPQGVISKGEANQSNQTVGLYLANSAAIGGAAANTTVFNQTALTKLNANYPSQTSGSANNVVPTTPQMDVNRQMLQFVNGAQTPKPLQPPLELWNKLRFWFNDDVRLSIASVSIPFGQRFITIDIAAQNVLLFEYPSIFLEKITQPAATGSVPATRIKSYTPIFQQFGIQSASIDVMELYINNIFVNPEVHDIYIKRIGFSLIRVYREHIQRCNQTGADEKLLSMLKWPIEYMFVGLRPVWNITPPTSSTSTGYVAGNTNMWRDWHRLTKQVDAYLADSSYSESTGWNAPSAGGTCTVLPLDYTGPTDPAAYASRIFSVIPNQYWLPVPTVDTLTLTSHGIVIYENFRDLFYNQYMPFQYGGPALVTPDDPGALMVNMALFPRSYQPSGHLNISRARETYLRWTTSYISSATPADLIVVAIAINFLLITDGSAVLRYST